MRRILYLSLSIVLSLSSTHSGFASENLVRVGPGNVWIPDVEVSMMDALARPVVGSTAKVTLNYSQDNGSSNNFYGCEAVTLDFYYSFNNGPMKLITTAPNREDGPDFNVGSFSKSNTFPVVLAGTYNVQIKGAIRCGTFVTIDRNIQPVSQTFPIDISKESFTAISPVKPSPLSIQSLTCTPPFKISMVKEISYSCTIKLSDPSHVADLIAVIPAPGTPLSPGNVISRKTAKKWTKTKQGWTVKVGFILLTVSPSTNSNLRAIERLQIGVGASDKILNSTEGYNFFAADAYANFRLIAKK